MKAPAMEEYTRSRNQRTRQGLVVMAVFVALLVLAASIGWALRGSSDQCALNEVRAVVLVVDTTTSEQCISVTEFIQLDADGRIVHVED